MNRIKELRKKHGMNQIDLAQKVGVAQSTLSGWESGKYEIDNASLFKLSDFFNCSVDYLLGRDFSYTEPEFSARDERDIQKTLDKALKSLEDDQEGLLFDGEPLDDETKELLIASLERSIRMAKVIAKEKYAPKKYRKDADGENNT